MRKITFEGMKPLNFQGSESYKSLRTNIQFCGKDVKVIAFTSSTPSEGKSVLVYRLSCSMAESGKKVLMIDADIRKSVTVSRLQIQKPGKGLSEYLSGQCALDECLCETNVENLHMILTGHEAPNPSELLGSDYFKNLLAKVREIYDYVFIDCPPLGSVIDAAVVASNSDGAILVIESGAISRKFEQNIKQQLERSGCRVLGAVLNKVEMESGGYYNRYYGKYYKKYYGNYYGDKEK